MDHKQIAEQADALKELLLTKFDGMAIYVRNHQTSPQVFDIRIDDMVYAYDKWHLVTVCDTVNILNIQQPGAVVGQLSYLLDKEKAQVQS